MTFLIDSDWVADFLKGRTAARELFQELALAGLAISIVTYAEILEGVRYGSAPEQHRQDFRHFLRFVDIVDLDRPTFERFADVRGYLRRSGQLIGDFDILIGVTALEHEMALVTRNLRHFQRIPNLEIYETTDS